MVNNKTRPLYAPKRNSAPTVQEAGWAPGPIWMDVEKIKSLETTGVRNPEPSISSQVAIATTLLRFTHDLHLIKLLILFKCCRNTETLGFLSSSNNVVKELVLKIVDNDQLDTQLLYFTIRLLYSSTCFKHYMLIIRRLNCTAAVSGIVTLSK